MPESFADLKSRILEARPVCEICDIARGIELHHCIVHDSKQLHKLVTVEENLMVVYIGCHPYANGIEVRRRFASLQIERGYDIRTWYVSLPLRFREQWILDL
ncbi:MAG: hypothetical protein A2Y53_00050 [Chloroflexi bacterium RBG_16_47_49]|nr:MAG: hypothetical protein A2Y53_00050 [Chloroflexi bacterium RBG_16_47_49]